MRETAIAGIYESRQGDLSDQTQPELWWECARGACEDAGLDLADIDGLVGAAPEGVGVRVGMPGAALSYDSLGKPLRFSALSNVGAARTAAGINLASYAVAAGLAEVVLIPSAAAGSQGIAYESANRDEAIAFMGKLSGPYEYIFGSTRVSDYAVLAQRHMYEFGTTPEQLAEVAVAERYGATLHPLSFQGHRGELTIEEVVNSKMVADPLHLLDCCAINQGGGAVVVTTAANVRASGRHAPVGLLGYGEGHSHVDPNALPSLAEPLAGAIGAETAFAAAGVSREDIDVCMVSDHFTIGVIFALEAAGFCAPGEGGSLVADGALRIGGRLPTNTSGGFLSFSHAGNCGIFQLTELVAQLRGTAGPRQVPGAALGYVGATGGAMQSNASAILGRL